MIQQLTLQVPVHWGGPRSHLKALEVSTCKVFELGGPIAPQEGVRIDLINSKGTVTVQSGFEIALADVPALIATLEKFK